MDRREFLTDALSVIVGFLCALFFRGCSGASSVTVNSISESSFFPEVLSVPLLSKIRVKVRLVSPENTSSRVVIISKGKTVLTAIKLAYSYSRQAPINDVSQPTTINGVSGHWRYTVNGVMPKVHAQNFQLYSDAEIVIRLL